MNFQTLAELPSQIAKRMLEYLVRSLPENFERPFKQDEQEPGHVVDRKGKLVADFHRGEWAKEFVEFYNEF